MVNDTNLQFIREKIGELGNAVMYVSCDDLIKLKNDIVTAVKVDEEGQLWFVTHRPPHLMEECEPDFPARLKFYKKGVDYFVEVSGKATIVDKEYSYNGSRKDKKLLVKLSMTNIEYTEPHTKKPKSKIETLLENGYNWFLRTVSVNHDSESVLKKLRQTH